MPEHAQYSVCDLESPLGMSRRKFIRISSATLIAGLFGTLSACVQSAPLKIAVQPWCGYQFLFLAQQQGWYPNETIQLIETKLAIDSVALIKQNQVDGAALTLDEVLLLRDQGISMSVVMIFDVSAGADVLLAKPGISQLSDLKGKRIGIENSSLGKIMLAKIIEAGNLDRTSLDITLIDFDHLKSWHENNLDAVLTYEPALSQLEALGLMPIFDSRSLPETIMDVLAIRTEALSRYADSITTLINGHFRALKLWQNNPIDTAYLLAMRLGVESEQVRAIFKGLDLPDALYNREYLNPPTTQLYKTTSEIAQIMTQQQLLKNPLSFDQLYLADYLPRELE